MNRQKQRGLNDLRLSMMSLLLGLVMGQPHSQQGRTAGGKVQEPTQGQGLGQGFAFEGQVRGLVPRQGSELGQSQERDPGLLAQGFGRCPTVPG